MKSSKTPQKTGPSRATTTILVLLFVMIASYTVFQIAGNISSPYATARVYPYESNDETTVNGYVIREESLLPSQPDGLLDITRREGERVAVGESVATVYADTGAMEIQEQIEDRLEQLEHLNFALKESTGASSGMKLESSIHSEILSLQRNLQNRQYAALERDIADLSTLVIKRSYAAGGESAEELTGRIAAVQAELKGLMKQQSKNVKRVSVSASGLFSAVTDGYESVLTPESARELTPGKLNSLLPDTSKSSNVGKMVYGNTWYYAANMDEQEAADYRIGQTVRLRFVKELDLDLTMKVESISAVENGQQTLLFSCNRYLPEVTLLRRQSANIIHESFSGLRIPTEALRMEDGVSGVYCLVGMQAVFKPVDVIFQGKGYYLVEPSLQKDDTENQSSTRLRAGDTVLVTAEELHTGKVIDL